LLEVTKAISMALENADAKIERMRITK